MSISLIESKRTAKKSPRSTMVSVAVHAVVISLAVYASASAREVAPSIVTDTTTIVYVGPPSDPAPDTHRATHASTAAASSSHAPVTPLTFSPVIPDTPIPDSRTGLEPVGDDRGLFGAPGSTTTSAAGTDAAPGGNGAFDEHHVEKPAIPRPGNASPKYPSMLESSRIEGVVLAQFVVDTLGRADMNTFKILDSSNDLFSQSLRSALVQWRFFPAEAGGHRVKQIVQLPLKFIAPNR